MEGREKGVISACFNASFYPAILVGEKGMLDVSSMTATEEDFECADHKAILENKKEPAIFCLPVCHNP